MNNLPPKWTTAVISDLIILNPKNECADDLVVGFVPMPLLGTRYLDTMTFETKPWAQVKKGYTHFQQGDVLLAKITPCFENGKAGIAKNLPNGIGAGSTEYFVCRPHPQALDPRYLLAWFKTQTFLSNGASHMTGSVGHKRVPKKYLTQTSFPLAPFKEQQRIADKLDATLKRVEACRERLASIVPVLKRFRQSILVAAITGRLTLEWRQIENAPIWISTDIQAVAKVGTGSTPLRSNSSFFASQGTPWITSAATSELLVSKAEQFVTEEAIAAHRLRIYPVGALLVAMYGEGKTRGQVTELGIPATINQACAAIVVNEDLAMKRYIKLVLQANYLQMRALAEGGNQPNLNLSKIKEFPVELPSLREQGEIIRRVERLFTIVDHLEGRLGVGKAAVEQLTQALFAKAFRGELVPQESDDESATELLQCLPAVAVH